MKTSRIVVRALSPLVVLAAVACGGSSPAPAASPSEAKEGKDAKGEKDPPSTSGTDKPADPKAPPKDKHQLAEEEEHVDPNESEGPIALKPLVAKGTPKSAFPKQTTGDHDCLKELSFVGKHKKDYETLIAKCGTPTGMLAYTTPAEGRLHAKKDKRDHFNVKVNKGMCYRYFAVADDGIKDIDIIILKKGALLATDKTEQPVAIIDTDKLWCVDDDMDLDFAVEIDGPGAGGYTFGVWTRPK